MEFSLSPPPTSSPLALDQKPSVTLHIVHIVPSGISHTMDRAVRSLSGSLQTCPICAHQDYLGRLAQHIREHHAQHPLNDTELQQLSELGLKNCPTCSLFFCDTNNTFTRHTHISVRPTPAAQHLAEKGDPTQTRLITQVQLRNADSNQHSPSIQLLHKHHPHHHQHHPKQMYQHHQHHLSTLQQLLSIRSQI